MIPKPVVMLMILMVIGWAALAGAGLLARLPKRMKAISLVNVGRNPALRITEDVLWAAMDSRFGFPTGFFAVDLDESTADRVVAREQTVKGTDLKSMFFAAFEGPNEWGRRNNSPFGPLFGALLLLVLAPVMIFAAVAEQMMRRILRSEIVAELTDMTEGFGTDVTLTLRGPSARIAASRLTTAFAPPRLPGKVGRKATARTRTKETAHAA